MSEGIKLDDLAQRQQGGRPVDRAIRSLKLPAVYAASISSSEYPDSFIRALLDSVQRMGPGRDRYVAGWLLCEASSYTGGMTRYVKPSQLMALLDKELSPKWSENFVDYPEKPELAVTWLEFFDWIGR